MGAVATYIARAAHQAATRLLTDSFHFCTRRNGNALEMLTILGVDGGLLCGQFWCQRRVPVERQKEDRRKATDLAKECTRGSSTCFRPGVCRTPMNVESEHTTESHVRIAHTRVLRDKQL